MTKIAVYFPGIGYHCDKPLLYYSRSVACKFGYENSRNVNYTYNAGNIRGNKEKMKEAYETLFSQTETELADIVCTTDGFVGKNRLMRIIGCIPAKKFMSDVTLVRDMIYAVRELKSSVLMYPEASCSFDGTQTPLPESLGKCLKLLKVPVVMIRTHGAFG